MPVSYAVPDEDYEEEFDEMIRHMPKSLRGQTRVRAHARKRKRGGVGYVREHVRYVLKWRHPQDPHWHSYMKDSDTGREFVSYSEAMKARNREIFNEENGFTIVEVFPKKVRYRSMANRNRLDALYTERYYDGKITVDQYNAKLDELWGDGT